MESNPVDSKSTDAIAKPLDDSELVVEDVDCPLGCPREDQFILSGRDRLHNLPGEYSVVKCCTCGLLRTNPRPTPTSMGTYYPEDYGPYLGTRVQTGVSNVNSWARRYLAPIARRVLDSKERALPPVASGRMLEVGCASGAFLHSMAEKGWDVTGIEFSESAANEARKLGYTVHTGALESISADAKKFDLIVAWMVLEHLHDPVKGLRNLAKQSLQGTWLALSVPDASSDYRFFKGCWYDLHLPNHLYHFTPQTIAAVLSAGGWAIESVHYQRTINNFLASCAYYCQDRKYSGAASVFRRMSRGGRFWTLALFPVAWLASRLGKTGRMTVWARRQS
jgi:SAM-dependent methyltransferase